MVLYYLGKVNLVFMSYNDNHFLFDLERCSSEFEPSNVFAGILEKKTVVNTSSM